MSKLLKKVLKSILNITILVALGLTLQHLYISKKNNDALEAARITTIRSNIGKYVVAPHVVQIFIKNDGELMGYATGFYLNYLGKTRIVTNKHVCDQSEGPRQMYINDKYYKILHISKNHDLCIIESDRTMGLELAASNVSNLDKIILVGHPRGLPLTIREGYVIETAITFFPWIGELGKAVEFTVISAISYPGNSGSPVTNSNGEVIGVLFAGDSRYITEGYIVPYSVLLAYLASTYKF